MNATTIASAAAYRQGITARFVRLSLADHSTLSADDRAWWHAEARLRGMRIVRGQEVWSTLLVHSTRRGW